MRYVVAIETPAGYEPHVFRDRAHFLAWVESRPQHGHIIHRAMIRLLERPILAEVDHRGEFEIADLESHLAELREKQREWLEANPDAEQPSPYFDLICDLEQLRDIYAESERIAELRAAAIVRPASVGR